MNYEFRKAVTLLHTIKHLAQRRLDRGRIGRPDLQHVQAEHTEARAAMLDAGFSPDVADQMEEMGRWLTATPHTDLPGPVEKTKMTLEVFAPRFREAYEAARRAVLASM